MQLRQLEYLSALAREHHFGRAAAACHVSQPALSTAIRKLELELGLTLVKREHRYDDLTAEGRELVSWAQAAVASAEGLASEAARLRGNLTGTLHLGVVPTSLSVAGPVLVPFLQAHSGVRVEMRTMSGDEIAMRLVAHQIDAGITYVDSPPGDFAWMRLYQERFVLVSGDPDWARASGPVAWAELADVPLGVLTPEMDDRSVIDDALLKAGVRAAPRVEADSPSALLDLARSGWSTIVAYSWLAGWDVSPELAVRPLCAPDVRPWIGLVHRAGPLVAPLARALRTEIITPLHPRLA